MWLDALNQAQLHWELAIAILDSALVAPSSKRAFAAAVGITPQYLSYLCDPLGPHQPSPALAERLAAALPGDTDLRHRLLGHLLGARAARTAGRRAVRVGDVTDLTAALVTLRVAREAATFAPAPAVARQYQVVRGAVAALLPGVSPARSPLDFCELCLLAHDVECVLNAVDRALGYAGQAQAVLADVQARDLRSEDPRFAHYRVNIPMAVAVAYNNLRLPAPALGAYAAAVAAAGAAGPAALAFWLPHLHRGQINILAKQPRFTLGDVTGLADQARRVGERRSGPDDALLAVLLAEAEGRAYIQYGNLRRAAIVLADLPAQAERVPQIGPLHHVIVRKTVAGLHWARGDHPIWADWIGQALTIGQAARLTHQVAGIVRTYGAAVIPILAEISATT